MQSVAPPVSTRRRPDHANGVYGERQLFARYHRDGDMTARRELVERFLPLARMLARRYERRNQPIEDLVQVASLALVKAIDRYEIDRGTRFSTFAVPTILGELRRHFRDSTWAVHLPRGMQEQVLVLGKVVEGLSADLGTSPTPEQISVAMGLEVEEVIEVMMAAGASDVLSLDAPALDGDDEGPAIGDLVADTDSSFELAERRSAVAGALRWLPERERRILFMRFEEDLTQSQIARRLGMSQMHVSRLIRRSLDRLRILVGEE